MDRLRRAQDTAAVLTVSPAEEDHMSLRHTLGRVQLEVLGPGLAAPAEQHESSGPTPNTCPKCGARRMLELNVKEEMVRLAEEMGSEVEVLNTAMS